MKITTKNEYYKHGKLTKNYHVRFECGSEAVFFRMTTTDIAQVKLYHPAAIITEIKDSMTLEVHENE